MAKYVLYTVVLRPLGTASPRTKFFQFFAQFYYNPFAPSPALIITPHYMTDSTNKTFLFLLT